MLILQLNSLYNKTGKCSLKHKKQKIVSIEKFVEKLNDWFRDKYEPFEEDEFNSYTKTYKHILFIELDLNKSKNSDIALELGIYSGSFKECDEALDENEKLLWRKICSLLEGTDNCRDPLVNDNFYNDEYCYEEKKDYDHDYDEAFYDEEKAPSKEEIKWREFCQKVQDEDGNKFLDKYLKIFLGHEKDLKKNKQIYTLKSGQIIYRARAVDKNEDYDYEDYKKWEYKELFAPPKHMTKSSRMNTRSMWIFYGAFKENTSIAELRPNIGEKITIGEFTINRKMKVFDLTVYTIQNKYFQLFNSEFSKPIPRNHSYKNKYKLTQIIAEYIQKELKCDAIIYESSVHQGEKNIAIFLDKFDNTIFFECDPNDDYPFVDEHHATYSLNCSFLLNNITIYNIENINYQKNKEWSKIVV